MREPISKDGVLHASLAMLRFGLALAKARSSKTEVARMEKLVADLERKRAVHDQSVTRTNEGD